MKCLRMSLSRSNVYIIVLIFMGMLIVVPYLRPSVASITMSVSRTSELGSTHNGSTMHSQHQLPVSFDQRSKPGNVTRHSLPNVKIIERFNASEAAVSNKEKRGKTRQVKSEDQSERLNRINNVCKKRTTHMDARHFINYDKQTNLAYCYLPKCGCTFWKQIYLLLSKMDQKGNIPKGDNPLDRGRYSIHLTSKIIEHPRSDFFKNKINFMFVRDPYSRLWAAYLDKLFLSDFWHSDAKSIVQNRKKKANCSHDVTFKEFIEYVISRVESEANEHWRPMINLCDPCVIRPQFVGKMESFSDDREIFLQSVGQQRVLNYYQLNQPDHSRSDISMLVSDYYRSYTNGSFGNCISQNDFNQRIWTIFQLNGHMPSDISFNPIIPRNQSTMIMHIHSVLESAQLDKVALNKQKKQAMIDAFKSLPKQYLEQLSEYYQGDFEMFGYDPRPKELFWDIPKI